MKAFCRSAGADLAGVADLTPFQRGWRTLPVGLLAPYARAISVAVRLDDAIIDAIADLPTVEYAAHYRKVNSLLDSVTAEVVEWMGGRGYLAESVPASEIVDSEDLLGAVSHKAIARMAGIGWQGKSLLIVSPEFGPRIRLGTVLTDMPLYPDGPIENRCGSCTKCTEACPAAAIRNATAKRRYADREEALFFGRCAGRTYENSLLPGMHSRICGVCVRACPHGRLRKRDGKRL